MTDTIGTATYEIDATAAEAGAKKVVAALNSIKKAVDSLNKAKVTGITQLTQAISAMAALRAPSAALVNGIQALGAAMSNYKAPSQAAVANTQAFLAALSSSKAGSSAIINRIATLSQAFAGFKAPTAAQTKRVVDFFNAINSLKPGATFTQVVSGLNKVATAANTAAGQMSKLQASINGLHMRMTGLPRSLNSASSGFRNTAHSSELLRKSLFDTVAVLQGFAGFLALRELVGASANLETARSTLLGVSDSAEEASAAFAYLTQRSLEIGVSLTELGRPFARFTVAAKNAGMTTQEIKEAFDNISGAARNFGLSAADTAGVVRALEQSLSKGKFMAEEVRLQLGDRLPIAMAALAQATGKSTRELNDMFEAGKLFTDQYFQPFVQALFDMSGGEEALARNSEGLNASLSRLETGFALVADQIGRGGLNSAIKEVAASLLEFIRSDDGQRFFLGLGKAIELAARAFILIAENIRIVIQLAGALIAFKLGAALQSWATGGGTFVKFLTMMYQNLGNVRRMAIITGVALKGMLASTGVGLIFAGIAFAMEQLISTTSDLEQSTITQNNLEIERARLGIESAQSILELAASYSTLNEEQKKTLQNDILAQTIRARQGGTEARTALSSFYQWDGGIYDPSLDPNNPLKDQPGQVPQLGLQNELIPSGVTEDEKQAIQEYLDEIKKLYEDGFSDLGLTNTILTDFSNLLLQISERTGDTGIGELGLRVAELAKNAGTAQDSIDLMQMAQDALIDATDTATESEERQIQITQELSKALTDWTEATQGAIAKEIQKTIALTEGAEAAQEYALRQEALAGMAGLTGNQLIDESNKAEILIQTLMNLAKANEQIEAIEKSKDAISDLQDQINLQKQFNDGQLVSLDAAKKELTFRQALEDAGVGPGIIADLTNQYADLLATLEELAKVEDARKARESQSDDLEKSIQDERNRALALSDSADAAELAAAAQEALANTTGMNAEQARIYVEEILNQVRALQDLRNQNNADEAQGKAEDEIAAMRQKNELQDQYNNGLIVSVERAQEELAFRKQLEDAGVGAEAVDDLAAEWRQAAIARDRYAKIGDAVDHLKDLQDEIDALGLAGAELDEYNRQKEYSQNISDGVSRSLAGEIQANQEVIDAYARYEQAIQEKDKVAAQAAYNELVRLKENAQNTSSFIDQAISWLENLGTWGKWAAEILKIVADVFGFIRGQGTPDFALPQDPNTMNIKWGGGGGGGGKSAADVYKDWADSIREKIAETQNEIKTDGMLAGAVERAKEQQELENAAKKEGITLSAAELASRDELLDTLEEEINKREQLNAVNSVKDNIDQINQESEAIRMVLDGRAKSLEMAQQELEIRQQLTDVGLPVDEIDSYVSATAAATERNKELNKQLDEQQALAEGVGKALSDAFKSAILDAKSFMEVLADLALQLAQLAFEQSIFPAISSGIGDAFTGLLGSILGSGGVVSNGSVLKEYGKGAIFGGPTPFEMSGGKTGVIGEAGPEAGMPLVRMPNGDLGVQYMGNGGTNVENNIHVTVEGGSSGDNAQDERLAKKVAKAVSDSLDSKIDSRLQKWTKPGAALSRGMLNR